jgi:hypothetical protein
VIRLVVMMYVRYPLSLRNIEDLLAERGIDICHETLRLRWNRFGPMFAAEIRKKRVDRMRVHTHWRWQFCQAKLIAPSEAAIPAEKCSIDCWPVQNLRQSATCRWIESPGVASGDPILPFGCIGQRGVGI